MLQAEADHFINSHVKDPHAPQAEEVQSLVGDFLARHAELEHQNEEASPDAKTSGSLPRPLYGSL